VVLVQEVVLSFFSGSRIYINRIKQYKTAIDLKSGGCSQVAALVGKVQHATNVTGS
jgi:hypothetical protein